MANTAAVYARIDTNLKESVHSDTFILVISNGLLKVLFSLFFSHACHTNTGISHSTHSTKSSRQEDAVSLTQGIAFSGSIHHLSNSLVIGSNSKGLELQ